MDRSEYFSSSLSLNLLLAASSTGLELAELFTVAVAFGAGLTDWIGEGVTLGVTLEEGDGRYFKISAASRGSLPFTQVYTMSIGSGRKSPANDLPAMLSVKSPTEACVLYVKNT